MQIILKRLNDSYHFESNNEDGNIINIDASPEIGGENKGMRPMQLVASALGSCSSIDIINILKKQRQNITDFKVEVKAKRRDNETPSIFETLHVHYIISGEVDNEKVEKAIALSLNKYCSVAKILEKTATITSSFEIL